MSCLTFIRPPRRLLGGAALALAAVLLCPGSSSAAIAERFDVASSSSTVADLCGLTVRIDSTSNARGRIRTGSGDDATAFFLQFTSRSLDVYTNLANHRYLTVESSTVYNEVRATRVSGSVFEFVSVQAGQPFVARDMRGDVVLRARGAVRTRILFDTGGDSVPGEQQVAVLDVRVAGPHPSMLLDEAAICARVHELIG